MALSLLLPAVTACLTPLVAAAVSLSSATGDVDLRHLASAISTAREEAHHVDGGNTPHHPPQRLRLHHLEAMWHTSLGIEVKSGGLGMISHSVVVYAGRREGSQWVE